MYSYNTVAQALMKYAYEDLSPEQFEDLIIIICQHLLGMGVQRFSTGPDGGRDAKFVGTAELHPSRAEPWTGTTIVQAKHTNGYNKTFSDPDFYSEEGKKNILGKELDRIKKLRTAKNLDNYFLFSNRRLSGIIETEIRKYISKCCNVPEQSVYLAGVEQLELYLKTFPKIVTIAAIDPVDSPLHVSSEQLAEIVEAISKHRGDIKKALDDSPPTTRVSYESKNKLNNMSEEYGKEQLKKYLKDTAQIQRFLAAPENFAIMQQYESVVDEFQLKIIAKRRNYQYFDEVMEYLAELLFNRDVVLSKNRRLSKVMLFYMYWNCDIGKTDASTN
jgi:hypothetical protein